MAGKRDGAERWEEQAKVLRSLRAYALDPVGFAWEKLEWGPDEKQTEVLRSLRQRVILNWGRQSGKTTMAAAKMAHTAATMPGTESVWVSARKEHTAEVFAKLRMFFGRLGITPKGQRGKEMAMVLANGSRILGMAAKDATVRGYTTHLLMVDEGAQVADAVYGAITGQLSTTEGAMWVLGTPRGKRGEFYRIWKEGDTEEWLKVQRRTVECGRVSAKFLESERKLKGDVLVKQEYECVFTDDGTTLLRPEDVDSLFGKEE